MSCHRCIMPCGMLAILGLYCTGCGYPRSVGYDVSFRPVDEASDVSLDGAWVEVQLYRDNERIGLEEQTRTLVEEGEAIVHVSLDTLIPQCVLGVFCTYPPPVFGDPPDEARVTVLYEGRTGSASVAIAAEDIMITEFETHRRIDLGTVAVTFEAPSSYLDGAKRGSPTRWPTC